jgi:hypothetical protein
MSTKSKLRKKKHLRTSNKIKSSRINFVWIALVVVAAFLCFIEFARTNVKYHSGTGKGRIVQSQKLLKAKKSSEIKAKPSKVEKHASKKSKTKSTKLTVVKVSGRNPINMEYAGKTYPLEKLPESLRAKYPSSVKFTSAGYPIFKPYAVKEVKVKGLNGDYKHDFKLSNVAAGFAQTPNGYTWHHVEDGVTMQLMPEDLHAAVRHTGGVALLKQIKKK